MLRGSEVSKDSYHSPVKKIKTIKKFTNWVRTTVDNLRLKVAVVLQLTTCSGNLFQAFTLRHTNELERQFTLQCCFMILNGWPRLWITLQLLTNNFYGKKSSAFASIYLLASITYCNLFGRNSYLFLLKNNACCIFWTPEYNTTFFAHTPISLYHKWW